MMKLLSEQPARLFGMYPQKGALSVGSDADITILAPNTPGKITAAAQTIITRRRTSTAIIYKYYGAKIQTSNH
jgi:cytosine/adenosine deaminase-related metal-dependent hydrolase